MKKKLILTLVIILVGCFAVNEYLYEKKVELPLNKEQIQMIAFYHDDNAGGISTINAVSEEREELIVSTINRMEPLADKKVQQDVAENKKPWEGHVVCKMHIEFQKTFWQRVPNAELYLYTDGHMMLKCSEPDRPYPHIIDFDHEYSFMRYYKASNEHYDELLTEICVIRDAQ